MYVRGTKWEKSSDTKIITDFLVDIWFVLNAFFTATIRLWSLFKVRLVMEAFIEHTE